MISRPLAHPDDAAAGLRRIIRLAVTPGEARGVVQDEFHHFRVMVRHEDGIVTHAASESPRVPYSLCPAAGERLAALVGVPLTRRVTDIHARIDGRMQCTHQFDLAALAIAAAARGEHRSYRILVTDPVDGRSDYTVQRDDGLILQWQAEGRIILAPEAYAGIDLRQGFTDWAARTLDEDVCEAALILRRAQLIANGRRMMDELNQLSHARPRGGCWVQQPERASLAKRIPHEAIDGLDDPEPDADDKAWLNFGDIR